MRPKTGASGKGKTKASKSTFRIPGDLMRRLRREAAALNLDVSEYMTLIVHGSEMIRQSLLPEGLENSDVLRKVLGTPLLLDMVKTTAHSVIKDAVQEYLPDWRSKEVTPEQLIEWLRGIGEKKSRPGANPPGRPGPGRPVSPGAPGPIPGPPWGPPPGAGYWPPGPGYFPPPGGGAWPGQMWPEYAYPPAAPTPPGGPTPQGIRRAPGAPSQETAAGTGAAGQPAKPSAQSRPASAQRTIYDLPWPPPDLFPR